MSRSIRSMFIQAVLAASAVLFLVVFLVGRPADSLLPLWGNPYEVSNAAICFAIALVVTLLVLWGGRRWHAVAAVIIALMLMAGPAATACALLTSLAAVALGYQMTGNRALPKLARSDLGRFVLAFWVGKAVYLLVLAVLSFFPVNSRFLHGVVPVLLLMASPCGFRETWRVVGSFLHNAPKRSRRSRDWVVPSFFFMLSLLLLILATVHPGFDGDAMTMHMRVAREMLNKGFWAYDVTEYVFAVMPLAPQLNFSAMFVVGGVEAVKAELVLEFLMVLALVATGGGFRARPAGLALAAVFCFMPLFVREIAGLFIEVPLCGFILASAVLLASGLRHRSAEISMLAGVCAAGAIATKSFGLLLAPVVLLVLIINGRELLASSEKPRLLLQFLLALALALFFYAVAWIKTGNPFFPFFNGVFKSQYWDPINFLDKRWIGDVNWDLAWRMTFESSRYEESSDGSMGLVLMFLIVCAGSLRALSRSNFIAVVPLCVGMLYLVGVGMQIQYLRYLLPGFLLISVSLAYYLQIYVRRLNGFLWFVTLSALLAANFFGLPSSRFRNGLMHIPVKNMFVPGKFRGILSANFSEESIDGHRYLGTLLAASERRIPTVLMLGCPYGAHFNGRTIYTSWHNYSWKSRESQLLDFQNFEQYLRANGVTHVITDGCMTSDQRIVLLPFIKEHYPRIAEWESVELYEVTK